MANNTHYSSGGGDFRVDVNITDFTEEITEGIKEATQRALVRIGLKCESYAKELIHTVTGRLKNSITNYVEGDSVYAGTNVEYAQFTENESYIAAFGFTQVLLIVSVFIPQFSQF